MYKFISFERVQNEFFEGTMSCFKCSVKVFYCNKLLMSSFLFYSKVKQCWKSYNWKHYFNRKKENNANSNFPL